MARFSLRIAYSQSDFTNVPNTKLYLLTWLIMLWLAGENMVLSCLTWSLRFIHGRIALFRPMLAQYCLSRGDNASSKSGINKLLMKDCAMLCVENAQSLISLVDECCRATTGGIGVLPWWFRLLYLHVAGTVLIAAEFQGTLHTTALSESWGRMMAVFRSHEHLSPFVSQCINTFETLWSKVTTHRLVEAPTENISSPYYFQEFFKDVGFDYNDLFLGLNNIP